MSTYTAAQIADSAYNAGFRGSALTTAVAVALAESGGNTRAHNGTPPDDSYGLWQINMLGNLAPERRQQFGISSNSELYSSSTNAAAARDVWKRAGSSWSPWSTYTNGAYKSHLSAASAAAAKAIATKGGAAGGTSGGGKGDGSGRGGKDGDGGRKGGSGSSRKPGRGGSGRGSRDRIVVDLSELKRIGSKLDTHHDVLVKLAAQAQHRTLDLDLAGLAAGTSGGWTVTDVTQAAKVKRDLDAATTGSRSASSAAKDLLDTAGWVGRFRDKMLAADGSDGRGSGARPVGGTTKPGGKGGSSSRPAKPKPRHPSSPGSSRTTKIDRMLAIARSNLATKTGITDGGDNDTKYGRWYGDNKAAWCAQFVSYVFHKSGQDLPRIDGPRGFEAVRNATTYAAGKGLLHSTPKVGDVFLYRDGHHTGIVSAVRADGTISTIEGNAGPATDRVVAGHRTDISAMRFWSPIR